MIEEREILRFPAEKQREIRQSIEHMTRKGRKPGQLMLSQDGSVMLDLAAASFELESEMFANLKREQPEP